MERRHPDNPNLLWCPKCKKYKEFLEFNKDSHSKCGRQRSGCRLCIKEFQHDYRESHRGEIKEYRRKYRKTHPDKKSSEMGEEKRKKKNEKGRLWRKKRFMENPSLWERCKEQNRKSQRMGSINCADFYIRKRLKENGVENITPELIEISRQWIIMKRTLKEFKKWRKENESNHTNVHGKQYTDEKDHEGRISA